MVKGTKTILKEITESDLPMIHAWRIDPEIAEFLPGSQRSLAELQDWFGLSEEKPNSAYFTINTLDGQPIGYAGLRDIDWGERTASLEIVIGDKSYWGHGFGVDAINALLTFGFESLGLNKISLAVLPYNKRATLAYERTGFRHVGYQRDFVFVNRKPWRPRIMQITKEQFYLKAKMENRISSKPDKDTND